MPNKMYPAFYNYKQLGLLQLLWLFSQIWINYESNAVAISSCFTQNPSTFQTLENTALKVFFKDLQHSYESLMRQAAALSQIQ